MFPWFNGCPECLADVGGICLCDRSVPNVAQRLQAGRERARARRAQKYGKAKLRMDYARSFQRRFQAPLLVIDLTAEDVAPEPVIEQWIECNVCESREPKSEIDETGHFVHYSGCPNAPRETNACFCGKIFCRRTDCYQKAVALYCGFVNY